LQSKNDTTIQSYNMKIALFGGSFNPVHMGHYEIVRNLNEEFRFQKIIIIPTYQNPLKETLPVVPRDVRLKMLAETFVGFDNVDISDHELEKKQISYTYQTLEHFKKTFPHHTFYLVIGQDAFASFHLWAKADRITELCYLLVINRSGTGKPTENKEIFLDSRKITKMKATIPAVSSTEIRDASLETIVQHRWLHGNALQTWQHFKNSSL
jgi:nicotinate-nucleotide adenylyltransferase